LGTAATCWLLYQHRMIGDGDCGETGGIKIAKYSEKPCPSATFSTTNLTCLHPVLNPGRRRGKPATNRLTYGAASGRSYCNIMTREMSRRHSVSDCSLLSAGQEKGNKEKESHLYMH
jgi:hypothetical protein